MESTDMVKVLMVSGSWPPQPCGVGDYADTLCEHLMAAGIAIEKYGHRDFSRPYSPSIMRQIAATDSDVVHIQYPTVGFGRSLTPSMIARVVRTRPVVVTLHEYAVFRPYRRAWFSPFAHHCSARIFTVPPERDLFAARFPARNGLDDIIEIASNIPAAPARERTADRVIYFGLIAPNKGLEDFVALARKANSESSGFAFELIGAVSEKDRNYADAILADAKSVGVELSLSLPRDRVAEQLATATYAYLPFPDGASAKRGSLAAAMVNGVVTLTRHTALTPDWLRQATRHAADTETALSGLKALRDNQADLDRMKAQTVNAATRFRWDSIARRHADLYAQLLATKTSDVSGNGRRSAESMASLNA